MNYTKFIAVPLFLILLFSCDRLKAQTSNDINNDLEIERNKISFEFRGFRWNTLKNEIIQNEGIPQKKVDGRIFYGGIVNTRISEITYFNKIILNTINTNKLEYEFIDNRLMQALYIINLANSDEVKRNFDNDKNNDYYELPRNEAIELFYFLRAELNERYVLLDDLNAEYFYERYNKADDLERKEISFYPCETRFGANETEIKISLNRLINRLIGEDTFWISIRYENTNYNVLINQLYNDDKLRFDSINSGSTATNLEYYQRQLGQLRR